MFKLAVNLSMIFTEYPLLERFALAKQAGFDHVEIQFPYDHSIEQIQQQLQQHDLNLCLINLPAGDFMQGGVGLASHPEQLEQFQHAIETAVRYANALNVSKLNVLSGRKHPDYSEQQCYDTFIHNLQRTCQYVQQHSHAHVVFEMINGVDLPNVLIQSLAQAQQVLLDANQAQLKMQFDCYHMAKMDENVVHALQQNLPHIGHIQFADTPHRHQPDTGDLDFAQIFQYLKQSDYHDYVAAEYRPQAHSLDSFAWKNRYFAAEML
ncbi:MAG: TIM barrel protein [Acinetobacter sp.]|nr:TIM barrel protein [Acinetobacter sp.]